jgi:hypothetical protein
MFSGEFIPRYSIWVFLLRHGYKLVNGNRPTHPSNIRPLQAVHDNGE